MQIALQFDTSNLDSLNLDGAIAGVETAMAYRFYTISDHNFGMTGEDRPTIWPALSRDYAKEFHGGNRIPKLILTGDLQASIQVQESNGNGASVYTDNPYAADHQYGKPEINLPARPFFPIIGNSVTSYTTAQCLEAGGNELTRQLN